MDVPGLVKKTKGVEDVRLIEAKDLVRQDWVREACRECRFYGRSWSCPPGVRAREADEGFKTYKRAVFVKFRSSGDRKGLEKAILEIESRLKESGFPRAKGFFVSPCSACAACAYPEPCKRPEEMRPTGESWGVDLLASSQNAGLDVEIAKKGESFKPVTFFLLD